MKKINDLLLLIYFLMSFTLGILWGIIISILIVLIRTTNVNTIISKVWGGV